VRQSTPFSGGAYYKDEFPSSGHTEVTVPIVVVPVVDVETVPVEITHVDTVAIRVHKHCPSPSGTLEIEVYRSSSLYTLFPVFYLEAVQNFEHLHQKQTRSSSLL